MTRPDIFAMLPSGVRSLIDALATAAGVAFAWATPANIVTVLTVIWWVLRIYETPTVQRRVRRSAIREQSCAGGGASSGDGRDVG